MDRKHSRLGVWALTLVTCLAVFGAQSAFAIDNTKPRVEGAGWVCQPGGALPSGCQETKFGITGKYTKANLPDGRFEYMNRNTKYNVSGVVDNVVINNHP